MENQPPTAPSELSAPRAISTNASFRTGTTYQKHHNFQPGQIVRWKAGMKNKKRPAYGEPAIVVEALTSPVFDPEQEAGSAYFREPLDIILGVIDVDGDFSLWHFDSKRFETSDER